MGYIKKIIMCFHLKVYTSHERELQVLSPKCVCIPSPVVQNSNRDVKQQYLFLTKEVSYRGCCLFIIQLLFCSLLVLPTTPHWQ